MTDTLNDIQKREILQRMFDTLTLQELENLEMILVAGNPTYKNKYKGFLYPNLKHITPQNV